MKKNLRNKIALIVAVLLICLYGIFGIPSGISGKALLSAQNRSAQMEEEGSSSQSHYYWQQ